MKYSSKIVKNQIENNNFNFKKKFGQNFIVDENIVNSIIDKALIDSNTLVIEIGPGAGSLTYKLALTAKQVLCYEIDESLRPILNDNLNGFSNVEIKFEDFLKADLTSDIKKYSYEKLYVVANLPYYITTPIIMKLIEDNIDVDKIVVIDRKSVV